MKFDFDDSSGILIYEKDEHGNKTGKLYDAERDELSIFTQEITTRYDEIIEKLRKKK